jgi:hypothetical protein
MAITLAVLAGCSSTSPLPARLPTSPTSLMDDRFVAFDGQTRTDL